MATEIELRHYERDFLYDLLKAEKEGDFKRVISKLTARMEQEDVKIVKQILAEEEESKQ